MNSYRHALLFADTNSVYIHVYISLVVIDIMSCKCLTDIKTCICPSGFVLDEDQYGKQAAMAFSKTVQDKCCGARRGVSNGITV